MGFQAGVLHPKWKNGSYVTKDGYVRLTAGPDRDKYEHRAKVAAQLRENPGRELRPDEEVHHQNFVRSCNHDWNLILMDAALHHGISGNRPERRWGQRKNGNGQRRQRQ